MINADARVLVFVVDDLYTAIAVLCLGLIIA
jgi:hypothetical protein